MVRAWLHGDVGSPRWSDRPPLRPVEVVLTDDVAAEDPIAWRTPDIPYGPIEPPADGVETLHRFTVSRRIRTGFTEDGNPLFDWEPLATDRRAILYEERREFDEVAGLTEVLARLVIGWDRPEPVGETITVVRDDGVRYRVTAVRKALDRLEVGMARIEQQGV